MLDADELPDEFMDCAACHYGWNIATDIVAQTGEVEYIDRAVEALILESRIEQYRIPLSDLTATEFDAMETVRNERLLLEAQRAYVENREAQEKTRVM